MGTKPWIIPSTTTTTTSVVSMARLGAGRTSVRIPVEDSLVTKHVQTGSGAHSAPISRGTGSHSRGKSVGKLHLALAYIYSLTELCMKFPHGSSQTVAIPTYCSKSPRLLGCKCGTISSTPKPQPVVSPSPMQP